MKLERLYIEAFGGLKKFSLDLSPGFNAVYGDNENGKSTVMSFIKMMFYGGEQRKSNDISKNIRQRYTPWDGSRMAGSIDFESSGRHYRLEREFGTSNSNDKLTLCDLDMGTREVVSGNIGQQFFGLSCPAFERSVFIGQLGASENDDNASGEINSKLSNITSTGDEDISYQTVFSRLDNAGLDLITKTNRSGKLIKNKLLLSELFEKLASAKDAEQKLTVMSDTAKQLDTQIKALEREIGKLKELIDSENDMRSAGKLREMLDLKRQLDELNKGLQLSDGQLIDEIFVRKLTFCLSKADTLAEKIAAKSDQAESLKKSIELAEHPTADITPQKVAELKQTSEQLKNEKLTLCDKLNKAEKLLKDCQVSGNAANPPKKSINFALLIPAIILLILSSVCFYFGVAIYGTVAAVVGVIALILSFVLRPTDRKKAEAALNKENSLKADIDEISRSITDNENKMAHVVTRLETVEAALNSNASLIAHQKSLLAECIKQISEDKLARDNEHETLFNLFSRYKPVSTVEEIKQMLDDITEKAQSQKELKQRLNYTARDVGNISYEAAQEKLDSLSSGEFTEIDFEDVHRKFDLLSKQITNKKTDFATLSTEIKAASRVSNEPESISKQIDVLKSTIDSQQKFYDAAEIAKTTLTQSFAEVRHSFGSALEKNALEIFKKLTGGKYGAIGISKSFEISVEETSAFGSRDAAFLSSGTTDQAYLSLRLAVARLISGNEEALPVMLDDVLTQYDDERMKAGIAFLKQYSEAHQTIMFTCHKSVISAAKEADANIIEMLR